MSGTGPVAVLYQPGTEYARSINGINAPWAADMSNNSTPFGPGGVGMPFGEATPAQGATSSYNPSRGPALGAFDQTNHALMIDFARFEQHRIGPKQLGFVSRQSNGITHDTRGMSMLNQLMHSDEGMDKWGVEAMPYKLTDDWNFYGGAINTPPSYMQDTTDLCLTYHVGKRARVCNVASVLTTKGRSMAPLVTIGDYLYLLLRRYKEVDSITDTFENRDNDDTVDVNGDTAATWTNTPSRPRNVEKPKGRHYWQLDPFVSHDRMPPHPSLYKTTVGSGIAMFIGTIAYVHGEPFINAAAVRTARAAMRPDTDDERYINALKVGYDVDVNLGVR